MSSSQKFPKALPPQFAACQAAINDTSIISITDLSGCILYVNETFVAVSKYLVEELVGKNHSVLNSGFHSSEFFAQMWQTIISGRNWHGEIKNKAKDGSFYWEDALITPVFNAAGKIFQFLSIRNLIRGQKKLPDNLAHDFLLEPLTLYRSLFNNSPFAIVIAEKATGKFMEVNQTATVVYGYSREEFLKLDVFDIRRTGNKEEFQTHFASAAYPADRNLRKHWKKNGSEMIVEVFVRELTYKGAPGYLITVHDVTYRVKMEGELAKEKLNKQKYIVEAQEQSRAAIGRELHDNINQLLVAAGLYLRNITVSSTRDQELLDIGIQILSKANDEIRKLSANLVAPAMENISLKDAIESFALNLKLAGTQAEIDVEINEKSLPENMKINIYRIVQEQVTNVIKYANARRLGIALIQNDGLITLEMADNGKGFNPQDVSKGIGFTNMAYRAEAYNGKLEITSAPGKGCRIYAEFHY